MNQIRKVTGDSHKTIGVAFPFFWSGNGSKLVEGIFDAAGHFKTNVLLFQGFYCSQISYLSKETVEYKEPGNAVYDLVSRSIIDSLVIYTGALKHHADKVNLLELCKCFSPLPMVSIGSAIQGIPNVLLANDLAIRSVMHHLLNVHKKRRIAYLRGPYDHNDSNERVTTYIEVLKENNIELNPDWISKGIWDKNVAGEIASDIIKKTEVDAFICTNDNHAEKVIEILLSSGIKVPQEIAVIGFNNDPVAATTFPPITTIDRNLYERGWKAVELLCARMDGKGHEENIYVDAPIKLRQSCGCLYPGLSNLVSSLNSYNLHCNKANSKEVDYAFLKSKLASDVGPFGKKKWEHQVNELIESFVSQIKKKNSYILMFTLDKQFKEIELDSADLDFWYLFLSSCYKLVQQYELPDTAFHLNLINQARINLGETTEWLQRKMLINMEDRNMRINALSHSLNTINNFEKMLDLLASELPNLGISACYLALYEDPLNPAGSCRLCLAFDENGRKEIPSEGILFKATELIPYDFVNQASLKTMIIEPLFFDQHQLGFTLFQFGIKSWSFYELLPAQLSSAIWNSQLYKRVIQSDETVKEQTLQLVSSNDALRNKATQLEHAYQQIQQNQEKLLQSEKMASLGKLTASIVHEMNTPLASVRASLTEIESLLNEYKESIGDNEITPDDHAQIAQDFGRSIALAESATNHAIQFIKSIKAQTRDTKIEEKQFFNIVEIVESVLVFLGHSIRHNNCTVNVNCSAGKIMVLGSPTRMTQVFTNLLTNAIDALDERELKNIVIKMGKYDNKVIINVQDNGCGIPLENLAKIFDPMFTTKPFGRGTGLGLAIIKDIVENDFGGTIGVNSQIGAGTTFTIGINCVQGI